MYAVTWVVAVLVATAVGLVAIGMVGDAVRGRGPLGGDVGQIKGVRSSQRSTPDPDASVVRRDITGDFGTFVVSCQGVQATGQTARADASGGWRVVRFEPGPDDDVDAVFANRRSLVDIEVFCNGGKPTIAEIERSRLPRGS